MQTLRNLLFILVTGAPAALQGAPNASTEAHQYLTEAIAHYGQAVERCQKLAEARPLPDKSTVAQLAEFDDYDVLVFLIGQSTLANDKCTAPEFLDLTIAMGILEHAELEPHTRNALQAIRALTLSREQWQIHKKYRRLPVSLRHQLESLPYFQEPFNPAVVERQLEQLEVGSTN